MRIALIRQETLLTGDAAIRYDPIAKNLVNRNGFSKALVPPYTPDDFDQPLYPLIVAAIYAISNFSQAAVTIVQLLLELCTVWLIYLISLLLRLPVKVGYSAVLLALLCPVLPVFNGRILTEVPATFIITLSVYLLLSAKERGGKWWFLSGVAMGAGLLTRPDLLISFGLLFAVIAAFAWSSNRKSCLAGLMGAILGSILMIAPWCYRNLKTFGELRPLGGVTSQVGLSYVKWLATWMDDPKYQQDYWWGAWDKGKTVSFPPYKLSLSERSVADQALSMAKAQGSFEGEPNWIFDNLTASAREQRPIKVFFVLPIRRTVMAWLRMPAYLEFTPAKVVFYLFWGAFLLLVSAGLMISAIKYKIALSVLFAWIAGRTLLPLISVLAIEPRYQIEAIPACIILASIAIDWFCIWIKYRRCCE